MKKSLTAGCLIAFSIVALAEGPAQAADSMNWNQRMLFQPSYAMLKAESRGRVNIYDGLHEAEVDRALDQQFGRIQAMMFTGTRRVVEEGTVVADDDCD